MSNNFIIRACTAADADSLALVGSATFLETFAGILDGADIRSHCARQHSSSVYQDWLLGGAKTWIAETEVGRAGIGYLVATKPDLPVADLQDSDLEIKRIYLLHRFQGSGLGRHLLQTAIESALQSNQRRLLLGVYANNVGAIAFYRRMGFVPIGTRRFRVGDHDYDDLVMSLNLA